MPTRQEYAQCIGRGMQGKQLSKEERKLEFCVVAKLCSNKSPNREEALRVCKLPKATKEPKGKRQRKPQSCEKEVQRLSRCMAENIDMDLASNINSVEMAIINAMMTCKCGGGT